MPDAPEQPVTVLGDLRVPCEHGLDRWHSHHDMSMCDGNHDDPCAAISNCPGGGPATVADLVSALRAEKLERIAELLFQLDAGGFSHLVKFSKMDDETQDYWREMAGAFLDALAEAQPFPPAGGVS